MVGSLFLLRDVDEGPSTPRTPQPPFSPPRRFSSLAFTSNTKPVASTIPAHRHAISDREVTETPQPSRSSLGRKRLLSSPLAKDSPSELQQVFQAARGALHRDMFAASSPASSIESRMNLEQMSSWQPEGRVGADIREWRYSTAPHNLATISLDVREPLPSPTLPEAPIKVDSHPGEVTEPVSSGFVSPSADDHTHNAIDANVTASPVEEIVTNAFGIVRASGSDIGTELDENLRRLQVDSDEPINLAGSEVSPTVQYLKSRSFHGSVDLSIPASPVNSIYMSESAEAAAESAKAKRRWLRGIFPEDNDREADTQEADGDMIDQLPDLRTICPDPVIHQLLMAIPCPEPSVHSQSPSIYRRPIEEYDQGVVPSDWRNHYMAPMVPNTGMYRATATGSPMPFTKIRSRPPTAYSDRQSMRMSPTPRQREAKIVMANEHFRPGWYYANEPVRPPVEKYSFSTAASKAIGSDQAPDSQMRDSYKTDTLTALPVPTSRYRKNGIGAEIRPRGVGRYYERPPSSTRTHSSRARPSSRQTYASDSEVRFRSSPPRALGHDRLPPMRRKRAMDDSYIIAEDMYRPASAGPDMQFRAHDDAMQLDEYTGRAVRKSIFGASTPEALRSARQGIRELSPNVQLYRGGVHENHYQRKKRRPSYWDNDLKEVRESPAGRGGVRSPVSAQESLKAEFEVASQRDVEMALDV